MDFDFKVFVTVDIIVLRQHDSEASHLDRFLQIF